MGLKISIITASYNSVETIADTIESVLSQTYDNIEYIIVDGASTDSTLDVVNRYAKDVTIIVSEQDDGIYSGFNKGMALATGDIIGFLNSDDLFDNVLVVEKIADAFTRHDVDSIYGDLVYVRQNDLSQVVRYWKSNLFTPAKLRFGWMPPHPTFYVKKSIYDKYGFFDTRYKIAADYDSILRLLGRHSISTHYISEVLVKMRVGGESNKNIANIINKSREDLHALNANKIGNIISLFVKNISKIPQFFRRPTP